MTTTSQTSRSAVPMHDSTRVLGPEDFARELAALRPLIGDYDWVWRMLRKRAARTGYFPKRLFGALRRFLRANRPYFVGRTAEGIAFLGDHRDFVCVASAVMPDHGGAVVRAMRLRAAERPGDYLDVGTNLGIVAAAMARTLGSAARRGSVVAFEPVPATVRRAAATFALNELDNVRLAPVAVSDSNGSIAFYEAAQSDVSTTDPAIYGGGVEYTATEVPCRTLDRLMEEGLFECVGLVKFDVEGHEPQAIAGAAGMLRRYQPDVVFEYAPPYAERLGWTVESVASKVLAAGQYELRALRETGEVVPFPPQGKNELYNILCTCAARPEPTE